MVLVLHQVQLVQIAVGYDANPFSTPPLVSFNNFFSCMRSSSGPANSPQWVVIFLALPYNPPISPWLIFPLESYTIKCLYLLEIPTIYTIIILILPDMVSSMWAHVCLFWTLVILTSIPLALH